VWLPVFVGVHRAAVKATLLCVRSAVDQLTAFKVIPASADSEDQSCPILVNLRLMVREVRLTKERAPRYHTYRHWEEA